MDKKHTIVTVMAIAFSMMVAVLAILTYEPSYLSVIIITFSLLAVVTDYYSWTKNKKCTTLGENLFQSKFGITPDKIRILSRIHKYDQLEYGISTNSAWIEFLSQERVYRGIVDMENETLHIEEPILVPVYSDEVLPAWKVVTEVYRNGSPKTVELRGTNRQLYGVYYLDEEGALKRRSWRKYKGVEEYWNPETQRWGS
jgi:hypothetical protein